VTGLQLHISCSSW